MKGIKPSWNNIIFVVSAPSGAGKTTLCDKLQKEFKDIFPECQVGAMPPFGNLYGMNVFVAEALIANTEIAFNAGSHTEVIKLPYVDFERLVKPKVVKFALA